MDLFVTKKIGSLDEGGDRPALRRHLGPWGLIALGIGMIVGAGLFSLTGIAAAENAGPAVTISFLVAALGCVFAGMCYSELATMIPRRRQRLYLCLCHAGRARRLDHRLGSRARIRRRRLGGVGELVQIRAVAACTISASISRRASALGPFETMKLADGSQISGLINLPAIAIIVALSLLLMRRHPRIGDGQRRHRRDQAVDRRCCSSSSAPSM